MGVNRQARREAAPRGSCLALWTRKDVRAALWEARTAGRTDAPQGARRPAGEPPRPVTSTFDSEYAAWVVAEGARKRYQGLAGVQSHEQQDPVTLAWVELVRDNLARDGQELVFFTGTYSDEYGMSHGLMLPRNVQADFKRALKAAGLEDAGFICSVEPHRLRSVLHCHALIEATSEQVAVLEHVWQERGWCSAPVCTDGGFSYCCKYALKSSTPDSFDWKWSA